MMTAVLFDILMVDVSKVGYCCCWCCCCSRYCVVVVVLYIFIYNLSFVAILNQYFWNNTWNGIFFVWTFHAIKFQWDSQISTCIWKCQNRLEKFQLTTCWCFGCSFCCFYNTLICCCTYKFEGRLMVLELNRIHYVVKCSKILVAVVAVVKN